MLDFEQVIIKIRHFADFEQDIMKLVILLGMSRQTASKLLYDALYTTINRKNEQLKTHNHLKYVEI